MSETMKKLMGGMSEVETKKAKHTGTRYVLFGTKESVKFYLTPKIAVDNPVAVMFRVRVECDFVDAYIEKLGLPFIQRSPTHASFDVAIPVSFMPCSAYDSATVIGEQKLLEKLTDTVYGLASAAGIVTAYGKDVMVEYMRNILNDSLPERALPLTEFPVFIGQKAIMEGMQALIEAKYPPPKPDKSEASED